MSVSVIPYPYVTVCDGIKSVMFSVKYVPVHTYVHMPGKDKLHHVRWDLCTTAGNNTEILKGGKEKTSIRRGLR